MCNATGFNFIRANISVEEVKGKKVIEVGALDVNGSPRLLIESLGPKSYLGVDISPGRGVDEICDITDLVTRYGKNSFDLVVCCEVFEHVRDWRVALSNLKNILKREGVILLTTRSKGFPYHGYPFDFWRFEVTDMNELFADIGLEANESDAESPGVFVKARKKKDFNEIDLSKYELYSILNKKRSANISQFEFLLYRFGQDSKSLIRDLLPAPLFEFLKKLRNQT